MRLTSLNIVFALLCVQPIPFAYSQDWPQVISPDDQWPTTIATDQQESDQPPDEEFSYREPKEASATPTLELQVKPQIQRGPVWCWAAVSGMVLDYYNVRNLNPVGGWQCGIVGVSLGGNCALDCNQCHRPAGSAAALRDVIERYPTAAGSNIKLTVTPLQTSLRFPQVAEQIVKGSPVITGINPGNPNVFFGASEHVALIVGFDNNALIVNDPFPYPSAADPYLKAGARKISQGQYKIDFARFEMDLGWRETLLVQQN